MENKKLEDDVAPTAEMQLGEFDQVKQLVVDADLGGRSTVGRAWQGDARRRPCLGDLPALVRIAAAVCASLRACSTTPRRARSIWRPGCSSRSSRFRRASDRRAITCRCSIGSSRSRARSPPAICTCSTTSSRRGPVRRHSLTSSSASSAFCCCSKRRGVQSACRWRCSR